MKNYFEIILSIGTYYVIIMYFYLSLLFNIPLYYVVCLLHKNILNWKKYWKNDEIKIIWAGLGERNIKYEIYTIFSTCWNSGLIAPMVWGDTDNSLIELVMAPVIKNHKSVKTIMMKNFRYFVLAYIISRSSLRNLAKELNLSVRKCM